MYELKVISQFAAAHQLRGFHGGCENLHGHKSPVLAHGRTMRTHGATVIANVGGVYIG